MLVKEATDDHIIMIVFPNVCVLLPQILQYNCISLWLFDDLSQKVIYIDILNFGYVLAWGNFIMQR